MAHDTKCHRRVKRVSVVVSLLAVVSLALAAPASAAFTLNRFITQGDAAAGWITETSTPPGAADRQSVRLFVNGTSSTDFDDAARAVLKGFGAVPDPNPPSFDFKTSIAGASGGSVRFLIRFNDGGKGELRPVTLVANEWTHVGGAAPEWDTTGGACGSQIGRTYAQVLACHPGATITQMEVLNDSGCLYPGGFQLLVDNISYAGRTISKPAPPVLGKGVVLKQLVGPVTVRVGAKSLARLEGTANLPVNSFIDSRRGHVRLVSARTGPDQVGRFTGGIFQVKQSRKRRAEGLVELRLNDSLAGCGASGSGVSAAAAGARSETARRRRRHRRRRLWGRGHGRYRTRGRYSSGTVRGTKWLTEDRCNGTLTVVRNGVVA